MVTTELNEINGFLVKDKNFILKMLNFKLHELENMGIFHIINTTKEYSYCILTINKPKILYTNKDDTSNNSFYNKDNSIEIFYIKDEKYENDYDIISNVITNNENFINEKSKLTDEEREYICNILKNSSYGNMIVKFTI